MEYRVIELLKEIKTLITGNKQDKWMDINEASKYCSVHPSTLRRNLASNQLKASKKLGKTLFKANVLQALDRKGVNISRKFQGKSRVLIIDKVA